MLVHFICIPVKPKAPWQLWLPVTGGSGQCLPPLPWEESHRKCWRLGCLELLGYRGGRALLLTASLGIPVRSHHQKGNSPQPKRQSACTEFRQEVGTGHLNSSSRSAGKGGKECHLILVISWVEGNVSLASCLRGQSEENPVILEEQDAE